MLALAYQRSSMGLSAAQTESFADCPVDVIQRKGGQPAIRSMLDLSPLTIRLLAGVGHLCLATGVTER